jgi:hypothetical protein
VQEVRSELGRIFESCGFVEYVLFCRSDCYTISKLKPVPGQFLWAWANHRTLLAFQGDSIII